MEEGEKGGGKQARNDGGKADKEEEGKKKSGVIIYLLKLCFHLYFANWSTLILLLSSLFYSYSHFHLLHFSFLALLLKDRSKYLDLSRLTQIPHRTLISGRKKLLPEFLIGLVALAEQRIPCIPYAVTCRPTSYRNLPHILFTALNSPLLCEHFTALTVFARILEHRQKMDPLHDI